MNFTAIIIVVLVFVCILGVPLFFVLRSSEESDDGRAAIRALETAPELEELKQSPAVEEVLQRMKKLHPVVRITVRPDGCHIERRIDREGEVVDVKPPCVVPLADAPLTEKELHLYRYALADRLGEDYIPQLMRDKKSRDIQGWCIYLHPNKTAQLIKDIEYELRYR